ncbi:hypothetical protein GCM10009755_28260 [Brevibacterium samyangense]|uniref:Uncharacterized protein n=1 Tax=Brevibacterium samyangense TaxID=366888 RepID=A0ABN2TMU4_9MICO
MALAAALGAPVVLWGLTGAALLLVRGTFRAREELGRGASAEEGETVAQEEATTQETHAEAPRSVLRDIGTAWPSSGGTRCCGRSSFRTCG